MTVQKIDIPTPPPFAGDVNAWVISLDRYLQTYLQGHVYWIREIETDLSTAIADISLCDASIHWTRVGTELNPKTAGDAVDTTGYVRMARLLAGGVDV
ncbi:MAG: hypothetical protein ACYTBJ_21585 [Planctomycetota bacterium]|jgi:hypothetical protein